MVYTYIYSNPQALMLKECKSHFGTLATKHIRKRFNLQFPLIRVSHNYK